MWNTQDLSARAFLAPPAFEPDVDPAPKPKRMAPEDNDGPVHPSIGPPEVIISNTDAGGKMGQEVSPMKLTADEFLEKIGLKLSRQGWGGASTSVEAVRDIRPGESVDLKLHKERASAVSDNTGSEDDIARENPHKKDAGLAFFYGIYNDLVKHGALTTQGVNAGAGAAPADVGQTTAGVSAAVAPQDVGTTHAGVQGQGPMPQVIPANPAAPDVTPPQATRVPSFGGRPNIPKNASLILKHLKEAAAVIGQRIGSTGMQERMMGAAPIKAPQVEAPKGQSKPPEPSVGM